MMIHIFIKHHFDTEYLFLFFSERANSCLKGKINADVIDSRKLRSINEDKCSHSRKDA